MKTKKVIILLVCALFLGLQCMVIFVPYSIMWGENWELADKPFWPFMRYPMYADGKKPGDSFMFQELRAKNKNGKTQSLSHSDLHLMNYRYKDLIWSLRFIGDSTFAPDKSDFDNYALLSHLIKKYVFYNVEELELWTKTYVLAPEGIENFDVGWKLELSRKISPNSIPDIARPSGVNK